MRGIALAPVGKPTKQFVLMYHALERSASFGIGFSSSQVQMTLAKGIKATKWFCFMEVSINKFYPSCKSASSSRGMIITLQITS